MSTHAAFAEIAALAGDPARASMLHALMDGRALTASELASVAGVTPQTASGHLARMTEAGLLSVEKQGRHRYFRLASAMVAQMVESLMQVASALQPPRRAVVTGPRDRALRTARTCYDHIAGQLGVALADALVAGGYAELGPDAGEVTERGFAFLARVRIELGGKPGGRTSGRVLCRPCLDWSERRPHLAGKLGAALCARSLEAGWIRRGETARVLAITPTGRTAFREVFGAVLD
ncbi:DNA-binding transcriptional ArsR family regulator [Amorphus suaedae]